MKIAKYIVPIYLLVTAGYAEPPLSHTFGTTSHVVCASRNIREGMTWTNTIVLQHGEVVKYGGSFFMAATSGTSTTTPPNLDGVTWHKLYRNDRTGVRFTLTTTGTVYLAIGEKAESGKGIVLTVSNPTWEPNNTPQEYISAIANGGVDNTVAIQEW